jgi:hypothetical protein
MTNMRILQLNTMILHDERKKFLFFLRSIVKGQDHSFFKDLMGVFCTVGGTLDYMICFTDYRRKLISFMHSLNKL